LATREDIRAAFSAPQIDGMDRLYDAIGKMLLEGAEFENAYSLVIAAGGIQSTTWIRFCVQGAIRLMSRQRSQSFCRCWRSSAGNTLELDDFWTQIKQLQLIPIARNKRLHRCSSCQLVAMQYL
jgi:hypothetical protein